MFEILRISSSCSRLPRASRNDLELDRDVEVILDRVLAAAGDEDDVVDAGRDRFFDAVLNDRLVDERQHFLGLRLGGGKEARAEAGGGKDGFADGEVTRGIVAEDSECADARIYNGRRGSMLDPIFVRDHIEDVRAGLRNRGHRSRQGARRDRRRSRRRGAG